MLTIQNILTRKIVTVPVAEAVIFLSNGEWKECHLRLVS